MPGAMATTMQGIDQVDFAFRKPSGAGERRQENEASGTCGMRFIQIFP
jgi:hypothetical protein